MSFTYNSVVTRPNTSIPWFSEINPTARASILSLVQSAPGYISGEWKEDPADPKKYLITHTWTSKAAWKAMSDVLQLSAPQQASITYHKNNNIVFTFTTSE